MTSTKSESDQIGPEWITDCITDGIKDRITDPIWSDPDFVNASFLVILTHFRSFKVIPCFSVRVFGEGMLGGGVMGRPIGEEGSKNFLLWHSMNIAN